MATVYSLICFAGRDGKTVTFTDAGDIVNLTSHGLRNGTGVVFTDNGNTLPTGLSKNTTYYAKQGADANKFTLWTTAGLSVQVTFTGTGTGTHKVIGAYRNGLTTNQKARYGAAGVERIYDGLVSWSTARAVASPYDTEVCEIGEAWDDIPSAGNLAITVPSGETLITSKVNGVRSAAFHAGVYGAGYRFYRLVNPGNNATLALNVVGITVDGFTVQTDNPGGYTVGGIDLAQPKCFARNMFVVGYFIGSGNGIGASSTFGGILNCVVLGWSSGIYCQNYVTGILVANNICCKNTNGFYPYTAANTLGYHYNNISIGNTTNWPATTGLTKASNNAGLAGEAWITGGSPRLTIATTDFVDYTNNNFNPAATGSPQSETGLFYYGANNYPYDIGDFARPNFIGATQGTVVNAGSFVTGLGYTVASVGTTDFTAIGAASNAVTFTDAGDTVGWTAHPFINGDVVYFSAITSTTGISVGTVYYVTTAAANTFQLSATAGGAVLPLTTNGTGTVVKGQFKATGAGTGSGTATAAGVYDVGAFEFDHGNGLVPEVHTLDFSSLVTGSQVVIYTTATTTELARNDSTGTTYSWDAATSGVTVDYTILKAGYMPIRVTGVALSGTSTPVQVAQQLDRAYVAPSGLTFGTNVIVNVASRIVTSLQVTAATTVQNWYSYLMDCWIASATNTTLKNVAVPMIPFGEASFTTLNGIEFSDGATSIAKFSRDGFRYSSDAGVTATAIWAAILTLDTPAGTQIKYRQATAGSIVSAANTGPMDQLVQVYGDASHGNYDYRDHMVLRAPKPGYSQPKPDLVATYGNLQDGFYVAAMAPALQYATTNADIDAAHLALDNTAKTFTITAAHTMLELYQRAQWWANQDAQWDADIPLTSTDGSTFTQPSDWSLLGVAYLSAGTLSGGSATLAAGTQGIAYNGATLNLGAEGTYTFTMAGSCTVNTNPTADDVHYIFGAGSFNGTLTVHNQNAHPIVVEVPSGTTTSSTGNTGGAVTFQAPSIYQSVTISGAVAGTRIQIYDTTHSVELYNGTPTFPYTWDDPDPAASTRAIRVRAAYVSGVTAKGFIEANIGTCETSGAGKDVSYLVSQTADSVYNANGIDGPSVYGASGITFTDAATDRVNCNIAGGSVTWPTIYACFAYWNSTSAGIANDFTYISAPDTANYLLSGMKIRNTSATDLTVISGYGRDATTNASKDIIDTAGSTGNIFMAPDHVTPYAVSGTYAITGDISTVLAAIPSAANNAGAVRTELTTELARIDVAASSLPAAVAAAAAASPLAVDVKMVNAREIAGTGVPPTYANQPVPIDPGDPFRAA